MKRHETSDPSMKNPAENVGAGKFLYKGKIISKGSPEYEEFQQERAAQKAKERSASVEVDPEVQAEYERRKGIEHRVASALPSEMGAVKTALSNFSSAWSNVETYEKYAGAVTFAEGQANKEAWMKKRESVRESLRGAHLGADALDRVAKAMASAKDRAAVEGGFVSEMALEQLKSEQESAFREYEAQAETVRRLYDLSRQPNMEGVTGAWQTNKEKLAEMEFKYESAKKAVASLERLRKPPTAERR